MSTTPAPFPLFGELNALTAALLWAGSLCAFRHFGEGVSSHTLNLFKNAVAMGCLLVALALQRPELPGEASPWLELALSGVVGLAIGDTLLFAALKRLGAPLTAAIQCLSPPATALLALLFLDETLTILQVTGMAITVLSVAGVIHFGRRESSARPGVSWAALAGGLLCAVGAAVSQAGGIVLSRHALQEVPVLLGTAIRVAPAILLLGLLELRQTPSPLAGRRFRTGRQVAALAAAAFCGTFLGVLCLSAGAKYAEAGVTSTLSSTFPIWILPIAAVFLGERCGWASVLSTFLAVGGIALIFSA